MTALKFLKEQRRRHINMAETMKVAYFDDKLDEAIAELEKLENKSCDGCKYDEKDDSYPSICWECSRYYADKFEKIKSYCEEQKDTWESQANGDHKVYEKILKELNK